MFNPSRDQVRDSFFEAWRKYRGGEPLTGIEPLLVDVILLHAEYHDMLSSPERHRDKDYVDTGNPFLHMSLHVALEEQLSIDQPTGIVERFQGLLARVQDRHDALHLAIECLAQMVWQSQRDSAPPNADAYLECLTRAARSRDK